MDPDVHSRLRRAAVFWLPSVFAMTAILAAIAIFPAAAMAWKNAAGSRQQGESADEENDVLMDFICLPVLSCLLISPENLSSGVINSLELVACRPGRVTQGVDGKSVMAFVARATFAESCDLHPIGAPTVRFAWDPL